MAARIQFRRGTAAEWLASNPVLAEGEPGVELDTDKFKIGNGSDAWVDLPYGGLVGPQGEIGPQGEQGVQGEVGPQGEQGPVGPRGEQGPQGAQGVAGPQGPEGRAGAKGAKGDKGDEGKSAYASAVDQGFSGTEAEFIASLRGPQGPQGERGERGPAGKSGASGADGLTGLSAYQIALLNGFVGTEEEWLASLATGGPIDLDDLTDVVITTPANNQILKYDSVTSKWINADGASSSTLKHRVKLGEAIAKGQAVYVSSANGTNMIVSKASNASESTSSKVIGLLETGGATNAFVNVITEGLLADVNTGSATAGDPVWLGTSGNLIFGLLNKPVAPNHLVFIGIVTRAHAVNGEIFVKPQNGFEIEELHNVRITSPATNQVLSYNSSTGLWSNNNVVSLIPDRSITSIKLQEELEFEGGITVNDGGIVLREERVLPVRLATGVQNFGQKISSDINDEIIEMAMFGTETTGVLRIVTLPGRFTSSPIDDNNYFNYKINGKWEWTLSTTSTVLADTFNESYPQYPSVDVWNIFTNKQLPSDFSAYVEAFGISFSNVNLSQNIGSSAFTDFLYINDIEIPLEFIVFNTGYLSIYGYIEATAGAGIFTSELDADIKISAIDTNNQSHDIRFNQSTLKWEIPDLKIDPDQITQSGATSEQVLAWNGTEWAPADASAGVTVSDTAPADTDNLWIDTSTQSTVLVEADIPQLSISKITNLSSTLSTLQANVNSNTASIYGHRTYQTGSLYGIDASFSSTGLVPVANEIRFIPFLLTKAMTAVSLSVNVTVSGTNTLRLGIYTGNGSDVPTTRLVDGGTVAATGGGTKTVTINQSLQPGLYWLAVHTSSGGGAIAAVATNHQLPFMPHPTTTAITGSSWIVSSAANLPATVTPTLVTNKSPFYVWVGF